MRRSPSRSLSSARSLTALPSAGQLALSPLGADPRVEITLSLLTPYLRSWRRSTSAVRASCDGRRRPVRELERAAAHSGRDAAAGHLLQGLAGPFLEGFVFLAAGMQTRTLLDRIEADLLHVLDVHHPHHRARRDRRALRLVVYVGLLPRWLSPPLARRDLASAAGSGPFSGISRRARRGFAGGGACAPLTTPDGAHFRDRDLVLFITFGVIITTCRAGLVFRRRRLALLGKRCGRRTAARARGGNCRTVEALEVAQGRPGKRAADRRVSTRRWRSCGPATIIEPSAAGKLRTAKRPRRWLRNYAWI